jgi:hypothetical protein
MSLNPIPLNGASRTLPSVAVVCCTRDNSSYFSAYLSQLQAQTQNYYSLKEIIIVHDKISSTAESTLEKAKKTESRIHLIAEERSDDLVNSIEEKAEQWAKIANQGIERALEINADLILWLESDLCFPIDIIDSLVRQNRDIIAPVIMLGSLFYDSWGFRTLSGKKIFRLDQLPTTKDELTELGSVGSCVLFRREVFTSGVRFRGPYETGLLVGVCNDARGLGYRVWVDPMLSVIHPTSLWQSQIWHIKSIYVISEEGQVVSRQPVSIPVATWYPDFLREALRGLPGFGGGAVLEKFDIEVHRDTTQKTLEISLIHKPNPR